MGDEKNAIRCGVCGHAQDVGSETMLQCRANPPQVQVVPTPTGVGLNAYFPAVSKDDGWCGRFTPGVPRAMKKIVEVKKPKLEVVR